MKTEIDTFEYNYKWEFKELRTPRYREQHAISEARLAAAFAGIKWSHNASEVRLKYLTPEPWKAWDIDKITVTLIN